MPQDKPINIIETIRQSGVHGLVETTFDDHSEKEK